MTHSFPSLNKPNPNPLCSALGWKPCLRSLPWMWQMMNHPAEPLAALHLKLLPLHLHLQKMRDRVPVHNSVCLCKSANSSSLKNYCNNRVELLQPSPHSHTHVINQCAWRFDWKRIAYHGKAVLGRQRMSKSAKPMGWCWSSNVLQGINIYFLLLSITCDSYAQMKTYLGFTKAHFHKRDDCLWENCPCQPD